MTDTTQREFDAFAPQIQPGAEFPWRGFARFGMLDQCAGVASRTLNPWWPRNNKKTRHLCQSRSTTCRNSFWLPHWRLSPFWALAKSISANSRWNPSQPRSTSSRLLPRNTADLRLGQGIGPAPTRGRADFTRTHAAVTPEGAKMGGNPFALTITSGNVLSNGKSMVCALRLDVILRHTNASSDSDNRRLRCPKLHSPLSLLRWSLALAPAVHRPRQSRSQPRSWSSLFRSKAAKVSGGRAFGPARIQASPLSCGGTTC